MPKKTTKSNVIVYQAKNGALELRKDVSQETVWASLDQMSLLFERDKSVVSRHIKNIFKEGELDQNEVVVKNAITTKHGAIKGKTQTKEVAFYNLDMIISVGYRINSRTATQFRIWATKALKQHITQGFTTNKKRIKRNHEASLRAVEDVHTLALRNFQMYKNQLEK